MIIDEIRERLAACIIPADAQADWRNTNHFEITDPRGPNGESFWWLNYIDEAIQEGCDSESGTRLGAVLDYACAFKPVVTFLLAENARLQNEEQIWHANAEKALALAKEMNAARKELADYAEIGLLTTPQKASAHTDEEEVLWWRKPEGVWHCEGVTNHVPDGSWWTPLPQIKGDT